MAEKNSLPLFLEDAYDALRAAVQFVGGAKKVAGLLCPHKALDQAHKELLDALNRDNPRKLDVEEILAILRMAREAGYHDAKHWLDGFIGYEPTPPADPKVQEDRLATVIEQASATLTAALKQAYELRAGKGKR
jgi:hypothetical protein